MTLGACGGSDKPRVDATPTTTEAGGSRVPQPVGAEPSISAKMVCADQAQDDIYKGATGVKTTKVSTPTWKNDTYACDYVYADGTMRLETKELANEAETTAFFDAQAKKLGEKEPLNGIGDAGFSTDNGSAVIRKDYKVLTVDVSKLPDDFGLPSSPRSDVAINTAFQIFQCWVGA